jgi:hypothetical protein
MPFLTTGNSQKKKYEIEHEENLTKWDDYTTEIP